MGGGEYVVPFVACAVAEAGKKSGNSIEAKKPKEATLALEMMAYGDSFDAIRAKTGLTLGTIAALKGRHVDTLERRRQVLSSEAIQVAEVMRQLIVKKAEQLIDNEEDLRKANIRDFALPWGIAHTKLFEAMGENKAVIEHRGVAPTIEEAQKVIEGARARARAKAAEKAGVVDVEVEPS